MTPTQAQKEAADLLERDQVSEAFVVLNAEIDRLTAAAEVGEPSYIDDMMSVRVKDEIAATIERCAQVAESGQDLYGIRRDVAAAIRKLKDA